MTSAIRLNKLVKTYPGKPPVEAVRGLDLEVFSGECFGLLGPNGAGKTTTMEIMEGLLDPTGGDVEVLGLAVGVASPEVPGIASGVRMHRDDGSGKEPLIFRVLIRLGLGGGPSRARGGRFRGVAAALGGGTDS